MGDDRHSFHKAPEYREEQFAMPDTHPPMTDRPEAAWIPHAGGDCPLVEGEQFVECRRRDGGTFTMKAGAVVWRHDATIWEVMEPIPPAAQVVAYREAKAPQ